MCLSKCVFVFFLISQHPTRVEASGLLMACLFINFYYYKGNEEAYARDERPIPTKIGMFVDYSWFVCLALTGKFLPTCYVLQITYKNIPTDMK